MQVCRGQKGGGGEAGMKAETVRCLAASQEAISATEGARSSMPVWSKYWSALKRKSQYDGAFP